MTISRNYPSRDPCGRADLVRALNCGEDALTTLAALLDYEKSADDDQEGVLGTLEIVTDSVSITVSLETEFRSSPPSAIPFWYLIAVDYRDAVDQEAAPKAEHGSTELPVWSQGPTNPPPHCDLAAWRELVPRLRRVLSESCDMRAPNVPAIVERLGRGASLERLPRRQR